MASPNPNGAGSAPATPTPADVSSVLAGLSLDDRQKLLALMGQAGQQGPPQGSPSEFKFWSTQPVPRLDEKPTDSGPIETKTLADISTSPYPLPAQFEWSSIDMNDAAQVNEVYTLLSENYVEDDENMFRFDYSRDFLAWALKPPGYLKDWHVGVRMAATKKLFAFISAIPAEMKVYDKTVKTVEINFLCVHKKLRSKRLAPVLIKEITRRVNLTDVWQAVYTAGVVLPKPVASNRYYHRSLNPKKLIDIGFSRLQHKMTIAKTIKQYKLPETPACPYIRPMEARDVAAVGALLNEYLSKFQLRQHFSDADVAHWLLPRADVVYCYVVERAGKITDFTSFYSLPSSIIGNDKYSTLKAAYSFYNVAATMSWVELMNDALIYAKRNNFDVFNALNVMENESFLNQLMFGIGDGHLQYYLYNWRCPEMSPAQVGLVLL